ncbi:hypothetical protein PENSPDRAFT_655871 [Peniophora sp. CONT]|nr:hypothetical protein PENSPDRAFT_655871 [Peniophora sp. CONT]
MATPPQDGAGTQFPEDPRDAYTPQQTYHRSPRQPYAPRQRGVELPGIGPQEEYTFVGPPDAPGQTGAYHARRAHRNGEYPASSDSPPRIPGRVLIDESAPLSPLLIDSARTRTSRSPLHASLSPPPEYAPSPRVQNRTSSHVYRTPTPDPRNTQHLRATPSRAAPSPGHNATPAHRVRHHRSPTPGPSPSEHINARQDRRTEARQAATPAQPTDHLSTSASPRRRASVQSTTPSLAPALVQYTAPAPTVAAHTSHNLASSPALVLAPAPNQHSSSSASADPVSTAAKRARDAEHVQDCHRRVRQKQELAERAVLRAELAKKDVQIARTSAEFAERDFDNTYATHREDGAMLEGAAAVPESAALALALQAINGSASGSASVPPGSGFAVIDAINAQQGEFAVAFERMAELLQMAGSLGIERAEYLRNPVRVLKDVCEFLRNHRQRGVRQRTVQMGEPGPSSYDTTHRSGAPARSLKTPTTSPRHIQDVHMMHV